MSVELILNVVKLFWTSSIVLLHWSVMGFQEKDGGAVECLSTILELAYLIQLCVDDDLPDDLLFKTMNIVNSWVSSLGGVVTFEWIYKTSNV